MPIQLFAYGSNMLTGRIRARVGSAQPIVTGYVNHRRLAYHKRGNDGSAKADAMFTGCAEDRLWGVVYSLSEHEKPTLDRHELGYLTETVIVNSVTGTIAAKVYVADTESIDASLKPFDWYHRLVVEGAREHSLPEHYRRLLAEVETVADQDLRRHSHTQRLLQASA